MTTLSAALLLASTAAGMAASFVAMNQVYGELFGRIASVLPDRGRLYLQRRSV